MAWSLSRQQCAQIPGRWRIVITPVRVLHPSQHLRGCLRGAPDEREVADHCAQRRETQFIQNISIILPCFDRFKVNSVCNAPITPPLLVAQLSAELQWAALPMVVPPD